MYIMYMKNKVFVLCMAAVAVPKTVKARGRGGANSLDLTLPAQVAREYGVKAGDVFALDVASKGNRLILTYSLVYSR